MGLAIDSLMSMLMQRLFRPIVRVLIPVSAQYKISGYFYSIDKGLWSKYGRRKDGTRREWLATIEHRLYWIFNPRGE